MVSRFFVITFILSVFMSCNDATDKAVDEKLSNGFVTTIDGIDVVSLCGTWEDMGEQYGKLTASHLQRVHSFLTDIIDGDAAKKDSILKVSKLLVSKYPYSLRMFFTGMSRTSGLTLEELMMNNAVEYAEGFFCSGLAAWNNYASGNLVYGRNYDAASYAPIADDIIITVFHPADGSLATATIGYAGEIYAVNAVNERGIFMELNNGMPTAGYDIDYDRFATTTSLFTLMFNAYDLSYIDAFFNTNRSFASFIVGVADEDEARSYEICATGVENATGFHPAGLIAMTNHYNSTNWSYPTPTDSASWNSITRRRNLLSLAESNKGSIDEATMCRIMGTTIEEGGPMHDFTRYQLVYTPKLKQLLIRIERQTSWITIDLNKFF